HLLVVEDVCFKLHGFLGAPGVLHQLALVNQQPGKQRDGDAVRMACKVSEDQVEGVGVFKRQARGCSAAHGAVVDEYQEPVGVLPELGNSGGQMLTERVGLVHGSPDIGKQRQ